jgi:hypothetical protein
LAALFGPVQNIFCLSVQNITSFDPIAQQAGQAAVLGRLYVRVSLAWSHLPRFILGFCAEQQTAAMKFLKLFQMANFEVFSCRWTCWTSY